MTLATGGTVTDGTDGYRRHTFTTSADLVVSVAGNVDYLLVGGGGGSGRINGANNSGGSGGGGVKTGVAVALGVATFPVVIGGGGAGFQTDGASGNGSTGTPSTFNGVTAGGGGIGAGNTSTGQAGGNGVNGGSGGGGSSSTSTGTNAAGGTSTGGGFAGGAGFGNTTNANRAGGGGGGAGEAGTAAASTIGGDGGDGASSSISGAATYYGGGGGGRSSAVNGAGGLGGGATGSAIGYPNATANTGGGGGGSAGVAGNGGGNGGSGLAIVRYLGTVTVTDAGDELYINGDSVTVTGTFFRATQDTGRVVISPTDNINDVGAQAQTVTGWGNTSVTVTIVRGSLPYVSTVYLFVENDLDASNAAGWPVTFQAPTPTITDADDEAFDSGGEPFTITGTNFLPTQGAGSVVISPADDVDDPGAVTQGVTTWSDTSIGATTVQSSLPSGVTVYLFVINAGLVSNTSGYPVQFNFTPVVITDADEELYHSGEAVTIDGTGFISMQGAGFVTISPTDDITDVGAVTQTVTAWSATSINITAVQGALPLATPLYLFVENNVGTSNVSGWAVQFEAAPVPGEGGGPWGFIEPIEFIGWIE